MSSLNKVMLIGRCGIKPEMTTTATGKRRTKLRVATDSYWRDDDGEHKATDWHNVVAWDRLAETCSQYLDVGHLVYVEGKLRSRSYKDDAGEERAIREVIAKQVSFLQPKKQAAAEAAIA